KRGRGSTFDLPPSPSPSPCTSPRSPCLRGEQTLLEGEFSVGRATPPRGWLFADAQVAGRDGAGGGVAAAELHGGHVRRAGPAGLPGIGHGDAERLAPMPVDRALAEDPRALSIDDERGEL